MPSTTKASYTDTGHEKAPREVEVGPSPAGISEAASEQVAEAYLSDSCYMDIPVLPTSLCDSCNDVCIDCIRQTMSAVNLLESPDGRNTWYVGPYGLFEIGQLRFPQARKSVTYVRGDICAETWASAEDAEAAGVELDLETEDGEDGEELEEAEEVDLEELIKEWREFCVIGQKAGWGPWLSCFERPAHIDRKKWNERSRRRADALNAKHEAKLAANRARSSL